MQQLLNPGIMWSLMLAISFLSLSYGDVGLHLNPSACATLGSALYSSVTGTLAVDDLFKGLNCTEQSMEINPRTQTVSACAPQKHTCLGHTFNSDRDGCLLNILEDLNFYRGALQSHPDYNAVLGPTVLKNIDTFMQGCFSSPFFERTQNVSAHPENKFEERLHLCKTLWGFRARIITINRSLRYIFCAKYDF